MMGWARAFLLVGLSLVPLGGPQSGTPPYPKPVEFAGLWVGRLGVGFAQGRTTQTLARVPFVMDSDTSWVEVTASGWYRLGSDRNETIALSLLAHHSVRRQERILAVHNTPVRNAVDRAFDLHFYLQAGGRETDTITIKVVADVLGPFAGGFLVLESVVVKEW